MFDVFHVCMVCRSCGHGSFEYILLFIHVMMKSMFSSLVCAVIVPDDRCQSYGPHDMLMTERIYW